MTGGTLSGNLFIKKSNYAQFYLIETTGNSAFSLQQTNNQSVLRNANKDGDNSNYRDLRLLNSDYTSEIKNALRLFDMVSGASKSYILFGEHNKPSGSYTGNGSAANRTIETGAISGSLLYVIGSTGAGIVTTQGAILVSYEGTLVGVKRSEAKYNNGVLTLATTNAILNGDGTTIYYHNK